MFSCRNIFGIALYRLQQSVDAHDLNDRVVKFRGQIGDNVAHASALSLQCSRNVNRSNSLHQEELVA